MEFKKKNTAIITLGAGSIGERLRNWIKKC